MRGGRQAVCRLLPCPGRPTIWLIAALLAWSTPVLADEPPEAEETVEVVDRKKAKTGDELTHRAAGSSVIIDVDHDRLPPGASVGSVLDTVAGVDIRRFGGPGSSSFVSVRGSSAQQVEVYVDGVPLNAQGGSTVDLSQMGLGGIDRIELHRSLPPAELGASPIGGVLHIRTRPDVAPPPRFSASYGSWDTRSAFAQVGSAERLQGALGSARFSLSYDGSTGDFEHFSHHGTLYNLRDDRFLRRSNNDFQQLEANASARIVRGPWDFTLRDRFLWRDGGVPGGTNARTFFARSGVTENLIAGHAAVRVASRIRVIADLAWRAKVAPYDDSDDEIGVGAQSTADRTHQPTMSLRGELEPTPWLRVLPFVGLAVDTYTPVNLHAVSADAGERVRASSTFKVAGELNILDDRLHVTGHVTGHLLDSRRVGADSEPEVVGNVSPAIAIALRPTEWITVRGSAVGQAFRPPAFHELFGDRGLTAGRAGLRPERADSLDGGVRLRSPNHRHVGGSVDLGGFVSHKADTIAWGVNSDGVATPGNLGRTREAGAELAGSLAILRHVSASASATYTDSTILEGAASVLGNRLPGVPIWQVHVGVQAFWDPYVRVGWRFDYTSGSFDSSSNFFEQAPRPLHSLNARVQPGAKWPWIAVDVTNLTNHIVATQARDPLHPDDGDRTVVAVQDFRGSPLPGRAVQIAVGWTWPESFLAAQENR